MDKITMAATKENGQAQTMYAKAHVHDQFHSTTGSM